MNQADAIVCKPTRWFFFRALVMLLMFGVFSVLFYIDGSTGYRKKNEVFYLHKTFKDANEDFSKMNSEGRLTPGQWKTHAEKQMVRFPKDPSILPVDLKLPMPWPEILQDYDQMKPLQWNNLWLEYSKEHGYPATPAEEPYSFSKIKEQWIVCSIFTILTAIVVFVLLRTLGRSISVDGEGITTQQGCKVPYTALKTLDLRKWETKGLAFLDYDSAAGKCRIRIDGLTYGGFKKEHDEPAERLMKRIRSNFSGEILEYVSLGVDDSPADENSRGST